MNKRKNKRLKILIVLAVILFAAIGLVLFLPPKEEKLELTVPVSTATPIAEETDFKLTIGKIDIDSIPIKVNVDGENKDEYLQALEENIAHLKGSSFPGQPGNSFLFGHSSYYAWKPGNYKEIFAHLDELNIGDGITIESNLSTYKYSVSETLIVEPDEVNITRQDKTKKQLTLMTCWPPGTLDKRMAVVADLQETVANNKGNI